MDEIKKHDEVTVFEGEKLIEDHEYDGIHELDNSPPPWLMGIWWLGVVFAVIWLLYYHVFDGPTQEEYYETAMANAAAELPEPETDVAIPVEFLTDADALDAGKVIWDANCAVCHLVDGGGLVGPNMTDDYWIYEPTMESMYATLINGVIEKGMTPFKDVLTTQQIHEVSSYIWSLQGTTPANPKAPEGTQYN